jgi:DNA-binding response OmpR family regulator
MKARILLIEDDKGLALTLIDRLESEDYSVVHIEDGDVAIKKSTELEYDLVLLDLMLKGKSGFEICSHIRSRGIQTPILILTARGQTVDKVTGFKLGADDYVTKPFDFAELLARIESLLRRTQQSTHVFDQIHFDDIDIDLQGIEVKKKGIKQELSLKEFQLLKYLIINRNRLVTRDELLNEVWGYDESPTTRTIDTHIGWLRQKLEDNPKSPKFIITVHGYGYKFVDESVNG